MKLKNIHKEVLAILQENKRARSDDMYLWKLVCDHSFNGIYCDESFEWVLDNFYTLGLPNPESVRRARQKIQAEYPELTDKETARHRKNKEADYLSYARADI